MHPIFKTDTLAYQLWQRPALQHRDMSGASLPDVVKALLDFEKIQGLGNYAGIKNNSPKKEYPERDALVFYMLNHAVSVIRTKISEYEPMGDFQPIVEAYHEQLTLRTARMFFYLLLICTRESRHVQQEPTSKFMEGLRSEYGDSIADFHLIIWKTGSETAVSKLRQKPPEVSLGEYTNFLVDVFHKGSYSSGYGGAAWGEIAEVLRDFVHGTLTAEMMMDTAFTLCHNNGPIFNKGMLYHHYTDEIKMILDVQRSGQIPQLVGNKETHSAEASDIWELYSECSKVLPDEFSGYVDWYQVEALGSLSKYPSKKAIQLQKYGGPEHLKIKAAQQKAEEGKLKAEKAKQKAEAEALKKAWIPITPSLKVMKMEKVR